MIVELHSQGIEIGKSFRFDFPHLRDTDKPFDMIWVSAGTFMMGSPPDEIGRATNEDQFKVTLTDGFWLGKYPVTFAHWKSAISYLNVGTLINYELQTLTEELPDEKRNLPKYANRYEALIFCAEMNTCNFYYGQVFQALQAQGYRFNLPTEAQWEYACRAGSTTRFYNGNTENDLDKIAWYAGNKNNATQSVGEKLPNDWSFHDMLGNVSEWCLDGLDDYPSGTATNWIGKNNPDGLYVNRGGYINSEAQYCRSARRHYNFPLSHTPIWGLRLCLSKNNFSFS